MTSLWLILLILGCNTGLSASLKLSADVDITRIIQELDGLDTLKQMVDGLPFIAKRRVSFTTVEYRLDTMMLDQDILLGTAMRLIPRITIGRLGNIAVDGDRIDKLEVNGEEFLGDPVFLLSSVRLADIRSIELIDDYDTDVRLETPDKVINILLKSHQDKQSLLRAEGGTGTNGRYTLKLLSHLSNKDAQVTAFTNLDNMHTNMYGLGLENMDREENGITTTKFGGFKLNRTWQDRLELTSSYHYLDRANYTNHIVKKQSSFQEVEWIEDEARDNMASERRHDGMFELEYEFSDQSEIKLESTFSWLTGEGHDRINGFIYGAGDDVRSYNVAKTSYKKPMFDVELGVEHEFNKAGRSLELEVAYQYETETRLRVLDYKLSSQGSQQMEQIHDSIPSFLESSWRGMEIAGSYIEPLGNSSFFKVDINSETHWTCSGFETEIGETVDTDRYQGYLHRDYGYRYRYTNVNLNWGISKDRYMFMVGSVLHSASQHAQVPEVGKVYRRQNWWMEPSAVFFYRWQGKYILSATYRTALLPPNRSQLQPVIEFTSPQHITIGNPYITPAILRQLELKYTIEGKNGNVFLAKADFERTQDRITMNRRSTVNSTIQETRFTNKSGFYALGGTLLHFRRLSDFFSLAMNTNIVKRRNIVIINDRDAIERHLRYFHEVNLSAHITANTTLELVNEMEWNKRIYSKSILDDTDMFTATMGFSGKHAICRNWTVGLECYRTYNKGFNFRTKTNYTILNLYVEQQLSRRWPIVVRLYGYNMLDQNLGINRTVTGNQVIDTKSNRLARFALLSLSYNFR